MRIRRAWQQPCRRLLACLLARLLLCIALAQLSHAAAIGQQGALGRRGGFTSAATAAREPPGGRGLEVRGRRYRLQLRYTACTGLVNQQYSHIAAFTLAAALGVADVHLPPAAVRDSFGHKFSVRQEQNQMQWFPARTSCLLDVERLQRAWAAQGVRVHEVRPCWLQLSHPTPERRRLAGGWPAQRHAEAAACAAHRASGAARRCAALSRAGGLSMSSRPALSSRC
jgi:hypothetical protein